VAMSKSGCPCLQPRDETLELCRACEEWTHPVEGECPSCGAATCSVDPRPGCSEHAHLLDRWCPSCEEWAGRWGWDPGGPFDCLHCGSPTYQSRDPAYWERSASGV
jgi:hypothetical protein